MHEYTNTSPGPESFKEKRLAYQEAPQPENQEQVPKTPETDTEKTDAIKNVDALEEEVGGATAERVNRADNDVSTRQQNVNTQEQNLAELFREHVSQENAEPGVAESGGKDASDTLQESVEMGVEEVEGEGRGPTSDEGWEQVGDNMQRTVMGEDGSLKIEIKPIVGSNAPATAPNAPNNPPTKDEQIAMLDEQLKSKGLDVDPNVNIDEQTAKDTLDKVIDEMLPTEEELKTLTPREKLEYDRTKNRLINVVGKLSFDPLNPQLYFQQARSIVAKTFTQPAFANAVNKIQQAPQTPQSAIDALNHSALNTVQGLTADPSVKHELALTWLRANGMDLKPGVDPKDPNAMQPQNLRKIETSGQIMNGFLFLVYCIELFKGKVKDFTGEVQNKIAGITGNAPSVPSQGPTSTPTKKWELPKGSESVKEAEELAQKNALEAIRNCIGIGNPSKESIEKDGEIIANKDHIIEALTKTDKNNPDVKYGMHIATEDDPANSIFIGDLVKSDGTIPIVGFNKDIRENPYEALNLLKNRLGERYKESFDEVKERKDKDTNVAKLREGYKSVQEKITDSNRWVDGSNPDVKHGDANHEYTILPNGALCARDKNDPIKNILVNNKKSMDISSFDITLAKEKGFDETKLTHVEAIKAFNQAFSKGIDKEINGQWNGKNSTFKVDEDLDLYANTDGKDLKFDTKAGDFDMYKPDEIQQHAEKTQEAAEKINELITAASKNVKAEVTSDGSVILLDISSADPADQVKLQPLFGAHAAIVEKADDAGKNTRMKIQDDLDNAIDAIKNVL